MSHWRALHRAAVLSAWFLVGSAAPFVAPFPAEAQWGDGYYEQPDSYASPPPRRRPRETGGDGAYGARAPARRYAPQEAQRQFFWPWEDQSQQAQPQPRTPPSYSRPPRPRPPVATTPPSRPRVADEPRRTRPPVAAPGAAGGDQARRRRAAPPSSVADNPAPAQKTEPKVQIAVFGDTLAGYLSKGLDQAFEENPEVAIVDRSRGDSGLVRKDVVDWAKAADEYLKSNPKVTYGLFMVGVNDRQPMREGEQTLDPLTPEWRTAYAARVDAVVKTFVERKIPLVWVNLPPVRSESLSRDLAAINDLVRERVQKAGQTFVDIWPGFVDERNRFVSVGPDVDGQDSKLRTSDGIHFTSSGSRKVAHFADVELKRLMGVGDAKAIEQPAEVAAAPAAGPALGGAGLDDNSAIDRKITAMLPSLPEPPGIPTLPVKPSAGPVVPLIRAETSPGGALLAKRPRDSDPAGTVERTLQRGYAPTPQPGRADDFRWPPG